MSKLRLRDNERVIHIIRRYGLTLFWHWLAVFVIFGTAGFFLFWLFQHSWWGQTIFFTLVALGVWLLCRLLFVHHRNVFYITTHRLIDFDRRGFFHVAISEVPYHKLEDVFGEISGLWRTIFRFGTLTIQTGEGKVKIILPYVKRPHFFQQLINDVREDYLKNKMGKIPSVATIIDLIPQLSVEDLIKIQVKINDQLEK